MIRHAAAAVVLAAALAAAGCSSNDGGQPDAGNSGAPATPAATGDLGKPFSFARADNGAAIGTLTVLEVVSAPDGCVTDPQPGMQALAIRSEIHNPGTLALSEIASVGTGTLDAAGVTQEAQSATTSAACRAQLPEAASSRPGTKTSGWAVLQVRPGATALQYFPLVGSEAASLENFDFVKTAPLSVTIKLPAQISAASLVVAPPVASTTVAPPQEPTTMVPSVTVAPATTTKKVSNAPVADTPCDPDVDDWGMSASGQQLKCAYAGAPTPRWVRSAPLIGTRTPGTPCVQGSGVAVSPSGQTLVCAGMDADSSVWTPGP